MSNSPWRVKPSEIQRTVKSVQATGLHVRNVEVTRDGLIRVNVGELGPVDAEKTNPWDEVLKDAAD